MWRTPLSRPGKANRKQPLRWRPPFRRPSVERLEDRLAPATLLVNGFADNTTDTSHLTLREAITLVNNGGQLASLGQTVMPGGWASQISGTFGDHDTINFSSALGGGTITLNGTALPPLSQALTITGPGAGGLAISGNNQSQVFTIGSGTQVQIAGLTIEAGHVDAAGGGIDNRGTLTLSACSIAGNSAPRGGGISNAGALTMSNCTLAGNSVSQGEGGGIDNRGTLRVSNSTLADNSAGTGGGINDGSGGSATLNNTIVAENTSGGDLAGGGFSGAYDLIGDGSDLASFTSSLVGDPLLAPLGDYGGPTPTRALLPGSPAIHAGSNALAVDAAGNPLATDQRGQPRLTDGAVDLGAYASVGLGGTSAGAAYSLSNGTLSNTATSQVIARNVASFAQNSQGELCYLQDDGRLWFYGDADAVAGGVTHYAIDGAGAVLYLGVNGVLNALTLPQPLDGGTPVVLFEVDGAGSAVVLDHSGNLIRYALGSETPAVLDSTVMSGTTVTSSVLTFRVDPAGSVVVLDSNGNLNRYAPGSSTAVALDTNVSKFAIDAAGSIVALEQAGTASVTLSDGPVYSTPAFNLVRFVPGPGGSLVRDVLDTGVATMVVDGAGSVVVLDALSQSSVQLADGQTHGTPSYTMVRFAPGSTVKQSMDTGVTQLAVDGTGSVVALDSLTATPAVTLGNGQSSNGVVASLVVFAPGSVVRQVLDAPTPQSPGGGVGRFALDATGAVVALDNLSLNDQTLSNGQAYRLWNIVRFAAPAYGRQVMDPSPVSSFVLEGAGTVVALDSPSPSANSFYRLVRLLPGPGRASYVQQVMAGSVSQVVVDASGTVFALTAQETLVHFAPGSTQGVTVAANVGRMAVDGSGSVLALDSPSQEAVTNSTGQTYPETVYSLVRFAPGSTTPAAIDQGVSTFAVDGSGAVVALDSLYLGSSGPVGQLTLFAPGSGTPQPLAPVQNPAPGQNPGAPVSSFTLDGSGSVVALMSPTSTGTSTLARFAPGSTQPQQLDATVRSFVIDGSGAEVALDNGVLERFAVDSTTPQPMPLGDSVVSYVVDGSGSVDALANGNLWRFAPGSDTAQQIPVDGKTIRKFALDGTGQVVVLLGGGELWRLTAGGHVSMGPGMSEFAVDRSGSVYALDRIGDLYLYLPGSNTPQNVPETEFSTVVVDGSGTVAALDRDDVLWVFSPGTVDALRARPTLPGGDWIAQGSITEVGVDGFGSVIADVYHSYLLRFAPGLTSDTLLANSQNAVSFVVDAGGGLLALVKGQASTYSMVHFAPGAAQGVPITDSHGNAITTISNYLVDGSGAVFVVFNGRNTFLSGAAAPTTVYSLARIAPGATQGSPVVDSGGNVVDNVSNFTVDSTGSVVVLDAYRQTLYRLQRGSSLPVSINYNAGRAAVTAFVVDAAGFVDALESLSAGDYALIQYAPGSSTGVLLDDRVQKFSLSYGVVVALDNQTGVGNVVYFAPGSQTRQVLDANSVVEMAVTSNRVIVALEMPNPSSGYGRLVDLDPSPGTPIYVLDDYPVSAFFVDRNGVVIASDQNPGGAAGNKWAQLVSFDPVHGFQETVLVSPLLQFSLLADGTMLALAAVANDSGSPRYLLVYPPGTYTEDQSMTPVADNLQSFSVASGVQTYAQWVANEGSELSYNPPTSFWKVLAQIGEVVGALVVSYFTAGTADPLIVAAADAGDALLNQAINQIAFGSPLNLGSIALGALGGAIGADGGLINTLGDLGSAVGGVVGDITNAIGEAAGEISDSVGDLIGNVIDPDSFIGQALQTSFNSAVDKFITTGSLGQAGNAALSSLENSVAQGVLNSGFAQDTLSFLNDVAAAGENALQDGLQQLSEIASDGLSGGVFGQTVASFLVNAVQNGLTGKPIFQNSLSFLDQVVADGLGDSPFAPEATQLMNQALTSGVNASLAGSLVSFLGQTAADGLANSSFVQDGLSFLNQTLAGGLGGSNLLQDGVNFLETTVANGLAGSTFSQQVGSFLQSAGALGLGSLNSTLTGELGMFLQEVSQNETAFVSSTLGGDVSAFLQQAGQDGVDFLNSSFVSGAGALLDEVAGQIDSLGAAAQANLGDFLQGAAQGGDAFIDSALGGYAGNFLNAAVQDGVGFLNSSFVSAAVGVLGEAAGQINSLGPGVQRSLGSFLQNAASAGTAFYDSTLGGAVTSFLNGAIQDGVSFLDTPFVAGASTLLGQASQELNSLGAAVQTSLGNFLRDAAQAGTVFAGSTLGADAGSFLGQASGGGPSFLNSDFFSGAIAVLDDAAGQIGSLNAALQTNLGGFLDTAAASGTRFLNSTLGGAVAPFLNSAAQDGASFIDSSFVSGASALLQEATQQLSYLGSAAQANLGSFLQDAAQAGAAFASSTLGTAVAGYLSTASQDGSIFLNSSLVTAASALLGEAAQHINSLDATVQANLGTFLQDAAMAEDAFTNSVLGGDAAGFLNSVTQDGVSFLDSRFVAGASAVLGEAAQHINSLGVTLQANLGTFLQDAAAAGSTFLDFTLGGDVADFLNSAAQVGVSFL
jgi:hypothetical protein